MTDQRRSILLAVLVAAIVFTAVGYAVAAGVGPRVELVMTTITLHRTHTTALTTTVTEVATQVVRATEVVTATLVVRETATVRATVTAWLLPPVVPAGTLVIAGGRTFPEFYQEVVRATGKVRPRIGIIPTASATPIETGMDYVGIFEGYGAEAVLVDITEANCRETAYDPSYVSLIKSLDGVFFTGGDQNRISRCLVPGGEPTPVLEALWSLYIRGGVISGNSAGAAIMSEPMIGGGADERVMVVRGLGFLMYGRVIVDQHFLARGRFMRLLEALLATGVSVGLGIDEDSAVVCDGAGVCRVIGSAPSVVVVYRRFNGTHHSFELHYLTPGDSFDLKSLRVSIDPTKRRAPLTPVDGTIATGVDIKAQDGISRVIELLKRYRYVQVDVTSESRRVRYVLSFEADALTEIYETDRFGYLRFSAVRIVLHMQRTLQ